MMQGLPPGFVLDGAPAAAPRGGPRGIPGTGPKPKDPPSGYELDGAGGLRPIRGGPADPVAKPDAPPSGFRWDGNGGLVPIPGGPADPATKGGAAANASEGERNNESFYKRGKRALEVYDKLNIGPRTYAGAALAALPFGDSILRALPDDIGDSAARRNAEQAQKDFATAILRSDSGANAPEPEVERLVSTYFPKAGETDPAVLKNYAEARRVALEALNDKAGRLAAPDGTRSPAMAGDVPVGAEVKTGFQGGGDETAFDRNAFLASRGLDPNKEATAIAFWNQNRGNEALTPVAVLRWYADNAIPPPSDADISSMIESARKGYQFGPIDTASEEAAYRAELEARSAREGAAGYGERADQGITLGLSDEAAGIGGAIGSALRGENPATGYRMSRDVERLRNEQADANTGLTGDLVELGSGLLLPLGSANTARQAVKTGIKAGALGGFGYGEGAEGSGLGAAIGSVAGGVIGYGGSRLGGALVNRGSKQAKAAAQGQAVTAAADELGMSAPARVFTDPTLQNRARAVSGTMVGGSRVQEGVRQFGDEIETAVAGKLGQGGQVLERPNAGSIAQAAFQRTDKAKKTVVDRLYDKYRSVSGDPPVVPKTAITQLDDQLAKLNRSPETNKGEIAYLQSLRKDMTNGKMTVETLLDMRRNMRGQISERNLGLTQAEARVQDILAAAGEDIAKTLDPKSPAYGWLVKANKAHADRVVYKKRLMADLVGKDRDLPTDPGKAFQTIQNWTNPRGDLSKLKALQKSFTPDEARDFAATTANAISRDNNGNFSATVLLSNIERLERAGKETIETLFGPDGAKAIANLKVVAAEQKRVSNAIAGQGSAQGNDWRSMLSNMLIPGSVGAVGADLGTGAGLAIGGLIVKAGRDALSAKMLMSPRVTKWIRAAPRTSNPQAIDSHWEKLGAIAKAEPALAADIEAFRSAVLNAANDNAQRAVAQESQSEGGR